MGFCDGCGTWAALDACRRWCARCLAGWQAQAEEIPVGRNATPVGWAGDPGHAGELAG